MVDAFKAHILKTGLIKKGERLLLGVSGGPDSMAMLHLFLAIQDDLRLRLVAAHFNHSLRDEADSEEKFVHDVCKRAGIKYVSDKREVKDFFDGDSLEQTARNMRYEFFLHTGRSLKIKKIALAHHKDDLAETVLMRIIRGSGLKGLRAIMPKTKHKSLTVVRPLLNVSKNNIMAWLEQNNFTYCVDKSNFEEDFLRNKLRLTFMPMLLELNPSIVDGLCNLAQASALDYDYIETQAAALLSAALLRETKDSIELKLSVVSTAHRALFNHLVLLAIQTIKGNTRSIDSCHVDEIYDLVKHRPLGSVVDLPQLLVKKNQHALLLQKKLGPYAY
jgi:tRNA(Ile)-lysidine synthase